MSDSISYALGFPSSRIGFVIVGCGGTGGYLIRDLARIVAISNDQFGRQDNLVLMDADTVEEKNIGRQNFIISDVGQNKAEVLGNRYGQAFGLSMDVVPEYLKADNLDNIVNLFGPNGSYDACVLVSCVDNLRTREIIATLRSEIRSRSLDIRNVIMVDSGNEEWHGQIVISASHGFTACGNTISLPQGFNDSMLSVLGLEVRDKSPGEQSCAEHTISAPQQMAVNLQAGQALFGVCNAILTNSRLMREVADNPSLSPHAIGQLFVNQSVRFEGNVLRFDAQTGAIRPEIIAEEGSVTNFKANQASSDRTFREFMLQVNRVFPPKAVTAA